MAHTTPAWIGRETNAWRHSLGLKEIRHAQLLEHIGRCRAWFRA
jgi:hypothetical protein